MAAAAIDRHSVFIEVQRRALHTLPEVIRPHKRGAFSAYRAWLRLSFDGLWVRCEDVASTHHPAAHMADRRIQVVGIDRSPLTSMGRPQAQQLSPRPIQSAAILRL